MDEHAKSCSACATDIFEKKPPLWKQKRALVLGVSAILLATSIYLEFWLLQELAAHLLYVLIVLIAGYGIIKRAFQGLLRRRLDMNLLITIAAIGAFLTGHAEEGAAVIFLFSIAEFLEDYAGERARESVSKLLKLAPETAIVKIGNAEKTVHLHEVNIGDTIIVRPGSSIPVDGKVIFGSSHVNQAPITGESSPVRKAEGSSVFAGTINEEGYLEIEATKKSDETVLAKIVDIVERAQSKKSKTEKFIDRFAAYYTPAMLFLAAGVAVVPTLVFSQSPETWVYRALVLLVISCPCALAISTPVSVVSAITSAARNGVLVKGGTYIEEIGKTKAVVFDKTGTLTRGTFEVDKMIPTNNFSKKKLLEVAASLERQSKHPIAKAIVAKARQEGTKMSDVREFSSITGKGVKGLIDGTTYFVGNLRLPISFDKKSKKIMDELEGMGKTVVLVANRKKCLGIISISDVIRKEAKEAIQDLKILGILPVMLTGDNEETAKAISKQLGIAEYYAALLPHEKVSRIEKLRKNYGNIVMVGDGVNDAPALAKANVGIAMGAIGSDVAIETADIALMHDDVRKVPYLIKLSKKTIMVVKENIVASILVKGSLVALAFFGLVDLWIAVALGDMGLSLAVILNALRIGITKLRTSF